MFSASVLMPCFVISSLAISNCACGCVWHFRATVHTECFKDERPEWNKIWATPKQKMNSGFILMTAGADLI